MRILLWHGYLLGGTGSNVYTRALAREWTRAGHDVTVLSQEPHPEHYDLGGRAVRAAGRRRSPARLRPRPLRGVRGEARPGVLSRRARRLGRAECGRGPRAAAGRPRLRESRAPRRAGGCGDGCALRRQGSRLGARVLDARQCGARRPGGGRRSNGRRPSSSAPRTSARCWKTSSVTSTGSTRCRPASTSTNGALGRATRRSPGCSRKRAATRRTPGMRASVYPTRATPNASPSFSRATARPSSTSGSSSTTRASTCCSRRCASSMPVR